MSSPASAIRAAVLRILLLLLIAMGLFAGIVGCMQRNMIYHPRPYSQDLLQSMPDRLVRVPYEVGGKPQVAFYLPPRETDDDQPAPTWVLFHGNASVALWWVRWIEEDLPTHRAGWLLVDYPGYGLNEGRPTRSSIIEAAEKVLPALADEVGTSAEELEKDLHTLGFSIGAAAAMEFAVRHPVKNAVLMSPFTSLDAMARRTVGWPLNNLLLDRFDNEARLDELAEREPQPNVIIVHGDHDTVVPFAHGRALSERHAEMTRFIAVTGGDHVDVLDAAADAMREILSNDNAAAQP